MNNVIGAICAQPCIDNKCEVMDKLKGLNFCPRYPDPKAFVRPGGRFVCPTLGYNQSVDEVKEVNVNPLKAAKREAAGA